MYAGRLVELGPVEQIIKAPKHPYTVGLMGSIPVVGSQAERLTQIEGSMPRLTDIPNGCAFHPRCGQAFELCSSRKPEMRQLDSNQVACLLFEGEF
jgi:peptide/nickel transport system ATP-binding protein